ncbi:histidine kinase [Streptomyces sp. N2-109]|uniref:histidine kinase n=1 Tax=Streptomyces gossypii TaxID=2883101 RepID=A0ABT2JQX2_9ACTN|nr:histidine kinase [Streptomyces gossypii]MCT2590156.1 histidine kinase [Streptomyces gossypii]
MTTPEQPQRGRLLTPWQRKSLLAAGFAFVVFKSLRTALDGREGLIADPGVSGLVTAGLCAVLLLCHRLPVTVALVTITGFLLESQIWPAFVALYAVTLWRPRALALGLTAIAFVPAALDPFRTLVNMPQVTFLPCAVLAVPLAFGLAARSHRDLALSLARQLEHIRAAHQLRDDQVRLAERARIAREMHDVLAHRLSLLVLHTGVLQRRGEEVPEPVRERLSLLRDTSAHALDDLRDLLGALRDHEGPAPLAPTSDDLPALIAESEAAGIRVHARLGTLHGLSAAVRLAVHRIVQEALTNARKHAPAAPVDLTVTVRRGRVEIRVENACPPPTARHGDGAHHGYGLVGIAERVSALHGELTTRRTDEGRFVLRAELPVPAHPLEETAPMAEAVSPR